MRVHADTIETSDNNTTRTTTFFASLTDGTHGVIDNGLTTADSLQRENVLMTISTPKVYRVQLTADDGTLQCKKITTDSYSCTEVAPITDVSGICIDDAGAVTSMGTTSVKTWIPKYFAYGQYKNASKTVAASTTNYASIGHRVMGAVDIAEETNGLCINDGGSIFCIKSNNMKNTKKQLTEYFGESHCKDKDVDNDSYYRCHSSNFSCRIYSDGKLTCHDYSNDEYCNAYTNGKLSCYTVSKS